DRIFLVQLATRARTAIVDPLVLPDLSPVGALLADPGVEKVFHDADYDLRILDRDYGFRAVRVFDTRIAAQLAGEPAVGLAALLEKYLGVKLAKEHQKADWSRRPLPPAMLEYAAADTQPLPRPRPPARPRPRPRASPPPPPTPRGRRPSGAPHHPGTQRPTHPTAKKNRYETEGPHNPPSNGGC